MKISDIKLGNREGISKLEGDIIETFYMIGMNTIKVRYNKNTGEVLSLKVNDRPFPLEDNTLLEELNRKLEEAEIVELKAKKAVDGISISSVRFGSICFISKLEGDIEERFYMVGMNTIRVRINTATGRIISIVVNGQQIDIYDPSVIEELNGYLDQYNREEKNQNSYK